MDRGIIVGSVLIGASFLLAVMLNRSAERTESAPTVIEQPCDQQAPQDLRPQPQLRDQAGELGAHTTAPVETPRTRPQPGCLPSL
jgi:hypothetical protein